MAEWGDEGGLRHSWLADGLLFPAGFPLRPAKRGYAGSDRPHESRTRQAAKKPTCEPASGGDTDEHGARGESFTDGGGNSVAAGLVRHLGQEVPVEDQAGPAGGP